MAENLRPLEGRITTMYEFEGGANPLAYQARGHVDKEEFAAEVRRYCAELNGKADWWDKTDYNADDVEHTWYHNVPAGRDMPGQMIMYPCDGPGRGRYAVTEIDIHKANYRHEMARRGAAA